MNRAEKRRVASLLVVVGALALAIPLGVSAATARPSIAGCPTFPTTNVWNKDISALLVRSDSTRLIRTMGVDRYLHPDFGSFAGYGIPVNIVDTNTPRYTVRFDYADESDKVRYPIPANARIEGGSDRHLLAVDRDACRLYELFAVRRGSGGGWLAGSGATWDLRSNALRPNGWTSADAAGLPITPGLVRYNEVARGLIAHALRFTAPRTRDRHIYPARHHAGESDDPALPPMGLRLRLKASVSLAGFGPQSRVILTALKRYGMILADNGSAFYVTGQPNPNWDDDELHDLHRITGSDFVVVNTTGLVNGP